jgi:hypothetical protein
MSHQRTDEREALRASRAAITENPHLNLVALGRGPAPEGTKPAAQTPDANAAGNLSSAERDRLAQQRIDQALTENIYGKGGAQKQQPIEGANAKPISPTADTSGTRNPATDQPLKQPTADASDRNPPTPSAKSTGDKVSPIATEYMGGSYNFTPTPEPRQVSPIATADAHPTAHRQQHNRA